MYRCEKEVCYQQSLRDHQAHSLGLATTHHRTARTSLAGNAHQGPSLHRSDSFLFCVKVELGSGHVLVTGGATFEDHVETIVGPREIGCLSVARFSVWTDLSHPPLIRVCDDESFGGHVLDRLDLPEVDVECLWELHCTAHVALASKYCRDGGGQESDGQMGIVHVEECKECERWNGEGVV